MLRFRAFAMKIWFGSATHCKTKFAHIATASHNGNSCQTQTACSPDTSPSANILDDKLEEWETNFKTQNFKYKCKIWNWQTLMTQTQLLLRRADLCGNAAGLLQQYYKIQGRKDAVVIFKLTGKSIPLSWSVVCCSKPKVTQFLQSCFQSRLSGVKVIVRGSCATVGELCWGMLDLCLPEILSLKSQLCVLVLTSPLFVFQWAQMKQT